MLISTELYAERIEVGSSNLQCVLANVSIFNVVKINYVCFQLFHFFTFKVDIAALPQKLKEQRIIIKFLFMQGKDIKQIHDEMSQMLANIGPSYATVKCQVDNIKTGPFSVDSQKPSGRPVSVFVPVYVKAIHDNQDGVSNISQNNCYISGNITGKSWCHYTQEFVNEKAWSNVDPKTFVN